MADALDDTILAKTGEQLFKELLRFYSPADPHDYFKSGKWDTPMLQRDVQLYFYHRSEAGAPDPTPSEDVKVPELPIEVVTKMNKTINPAAVASSDAASTAAVAAATKERSASNLTALQSTMAKLTAARLAGAGGTSTLKLNAGTPAISAAGGAAKVAVAELKEIAMFVAKFKFEPARVKAVLAKLDTNKRRYVIQKFASDSSGAEATESLEGYVAECEVSNDWDGFTAEPAAAAKPAAAKPLLAGLKPAAPKILASKPLLASNLLKRPAPAAWAAGPKAKAPAIAVRTLPLRPATGGKGL